MSGEEEGVCLLLMGSDDRKTENVCTGAYDKLIVAVTSYLRFVECACKTNELSEGASN